MRTLIYKRTHHGDPDETGQFGIHDCMGRVRTWDFDAVIGVGGQGPEPRSHGLDGKVNWTVLDRVEGGGTSAGQSSPSIISSSTGPTAQTSRSEPLFSQRGSTQGTCVS